jgi:OmpA-OmpF porin, OOP family
MPRRIPFFLLALGAASSFASSEARAADCSGIASTCINDDTLWPHPGPARFVAVGSTETVAAGQLGFGLVATYLSDPIRLDERSPGGAGSEQDVIGPQGTGTFVWSYGVSDRLELDLALPITFGEGGTGIAPITGGIGLRDTAVRDLRFGFAYALLPHRRVDPDAPRPASGSVQTPSPFGLAARFEVSAPTGDSDQFAGEGTAVFIPSLSADLQVGRFFAGLELGARIRPVTELLGARVGTQLVTALGVGYDILPRELLTATLEAWALPTFAEQGTISVQNGELTSTPNGEHIVPAEWQLAARTAPLRGGDLSIQLGGGGPIPLTGEETLPRPDVRFTLGVRWEPLARDSDGDGVLDSVDKCPDQAAPRTSDGCPPRAPASRQTPLVDLHISVAKDPCTDDPDLVARFGEDGCPAARPEPAPPSPVAPSAPGTP